MPAALLTPDGWREVRSASESGVDDETLAQRYQISRVSIRKRRSTEEWKTPERLLAEAERQKQDASLSRIATGAVSRISQAPTNAIEMVGKSLAELAEQHPLVMAKYLSSKIEEAVTGDRLPEINNWKSLSAADQMLRRNLGLDRPQTAVQVNLGFTPKTGSQHWLDSAQVVEVEGDEGE